MLVYELAPNVAVPLHKPVMMELPSDKAATSETRTELVPPTFVAHAKLPSAFNFAVKPSASFVTERLIESPKLAVPKNIPHNKELPSSKRSIEKACVRLAPPARWGNDMGASFDGFQS